MYTIYKEPGITINDVILKFKEKSGFKKVCFCGRLDPMARGELLLLTDENCKKMPLYLKKDKIYEFKIVVGIQSDSDDSLGIINKIDTDFNVKQIYEKLKNVLENYPKKFKQQFHQFSSKRVNNKPLWMYSRDGIKLDNYPSHIVELKNIKIGNIHKKDFATFLQTILHRIDSIGESHNFRQNEIKKKWNSINLDYVYHIVVEITVSSGFYVRQFVRDLSNEINFPLLTFDINRKTILK